MYVRRFLRDVDRRIHRNSHVRISHGYGIVNTISQNPTVWPRLSELEPPRAPCGVDSFSPKTLVSSASSPIVVAHILDFITQDDFSGVEADFTADLGSYDRIGCSRV